MKLRTYGKKGHGVSRIAEYVPFSKEAAGDWVDLRELWQNLVADMLQSVRRRAMAARFEEDWDTVGQELERLEFGRVVDWDRKVQVEVRCECCGQIIDEED